MIKAETERTETEEQGQSGGELNLDAQKAGFHAVEDYTKKEKKKNRRGSFLELEKLHWPLGKSWRKLISYKNKQQKYQGQIPCNVIEKTE